MDAAVECLPRVEQQPSVLRQHCREGLRCCPLETSVPGGREEEACRNGHPRAACGKLRGALAGQLQPHLDQGRPQLARQLDPRLLGLEAVAEREQHEVRGVAGGSGAFGLSQRAARVGRVVLLHPHVRAGPSSRRARDSLAPSGCDCRDDLVVKVLAAPPQREEDHTQRGHNRKEQGRHCAGKKGGNGRRDDTGQRVTPGVQHRADRDGDE
mmetsp:Transcript_21450/g.67779  ORF Transcript_21450/g.67779 Transcript_21450/m.67779 type:complete len:211 (-) Transcript_21450:2455-3087(-)